MKTKNWRRSGIQGLIIGTGVYLLMRFFVPHWLDNETRSEIGAVATFVIAFIILAIGNSEKP